MTLNIKGEEIKRIDKLSPILKWAGGKEKELKYIMPLIPKNINKYFEPFVGGGAVYLSIKAKEYYINDKSDELINLYKSIQKEEKEFFYYLNEINHNWKLISNIVKDNKDMFIRIYKLFRNNEINLEDIENEISSFILKQSHLFNGMFDYLFNKDIKHFFNEINKSLTSKIKRMKKIESEKNIMPDEDILDNIESALKSAFYTHFRYLYNNIQKFNINKNFATAIFFFIRNYAYSGMFRYNSKGEFNVPYGGIGYNKKNLDKKIEYFHNSLLINKLQQTIIENLDFEVFLKKYNPTENDFVFLDPPYDTEFSTYALNEFSKEDQKRLANYLINECKAKWLMVIKYTDFIYKLYNNKKNINITSFDKKYLVSFKNRNNKKAIHLIIKNY
jgi:DNA adenine methylase